MTTLGQPRRAVLAPEAAVAPLSPPWQELSLVGVASTLAALGVADGANVPNWMNVAVPVILSFGLVAGVAILLRRSAKMIWVPLVWLRLVMVAYSGVGTLAPLVGNDATKTVIESFYAVYPEDIAKYNLVSCVFVLMIFGGSWLALLFWRGSPRNLREDTWRSSFSLRTMVISAFVIGIPVRLLAYAAELGLLGDIALPASLLIFSSLTYLGYALSSLYARQQGRRSIFFWAVAIALVDALMGVSNFNKTEILLPLTFIVIGYLGVAESLTKASIALALVGALYAALVPLVTFGRAALLYQGGESATLGQRAGIVSEYYTDWTRPEEQSQESLLRLSYVTGGSFAVNRYDQGRPGSTIADSMIVFMPRVIYPDKPNITAVFSQFNYEVNGNAESQSSPGIPPEAYWNYGWAGVILVGLLMGSVYTLWSVYTLYVFQFEAWHLLFVSLWGIRVAARIDGMFVTDFLVGIVYAIVFHFLLNVANRLGRDLGRHRSSVRTRGVA